MDSKKTRTIQSRSKASLILEFALFGFGAVMMLPIVLTILGSVKTPLEVMSVPMQWFPQKWLWSNYTKALSRFPVYRYFLNSLIVATIVTASQLIFCSMAGYSLAKYQYPGRDLALLGILSTMMIPAPVVIVPMYIMAYHAGLTDTMLGLILPGIATGFAVFLLRQAFLSVPSDYLDAGRIDGAGELRIFFTICLPMIKPSLSALAIFAFMGTWNEFLWPLVLINSADKRTLPLAIANFKGEYFTEWGQVLAMSVLAMLPVILFFLAFRRNFIQGVTLSGIKG